MAKPITCILIDDDIDEHHLFEMALIDVGFPISCHYFTKCERASEFINQAGIYIPDFVFVDWRLAGTEGRDCISFLGKESKLNPSQVYIYSGIDDQSLYFTSLNKEMIRILPKQATVTDLTKQLLTIFV